MLSLLAHRRRLIILRRDEPTRRAPFAPGDNWLLKIDLHLKIVCVTSEPMKRMEFVGRGWMSGVIGRKNDRRIGDADGAAGWFRDDGRW